MLTLQRGELLEMQTPYFCINGVVIIVVDQSENNGCCFKVVDELDPGQQTELGHQHKFVKKLMDVSIVCFDSVLLDFFVDLIEASHLLLLDGHPIQQDGLQNI